MGKPRRFEMNPSPWAARAGVTRPDLDPFLLDDDVSPILVLGNYGTAMRGFGRVHVWTSQVPANAIAFGIISFGLQQTAPLPGANWGYWIHGCVAQHLDDGSPLQFATGNIIPRPAVSAAGTTVQAARFDDFEDPSTFPTTINPVTGHQAASPGLQAFWPQIFPFRSGAIWWSGTNLWWAGVAVNRAIQVDLWVEDALPGNERQNRA